METIAQAWIACTGMTAVFLSQQSSANLKKYASIFGLLGQPAWIYATFSAEQWGIFIMCVFYTYAWGLGFYNHWIKNNGQL